MLWDAEKQNKLLSDKGVLCSLLKSLLFFEFQGASWVMILSGMVFVSPPPISFKENFGVSHNC